MQLHIPPPLSLGSVSDYGIRGCIEAGHPMPNIYQIGSFLVKFKMICTGTAWWIENTLNYSCLVSSSVVSIWLFSKGVFVTSIIWLQASGPHPRFNHWLLGVCQHWLGQRPLGSGSFLSWLRTLGVRHQVKDFPMLARSKAFDVKSFLS